jgi:uncharacterized membrane protein
MSDSQQPASDKAAACSTTGDADCFHTGMAHLYRGEMHRMTVWRTRLDTTTHWAIILTTGLTTFVLGAAKIPHYIMLLGLAFNTIFMLIEGRRYQHLHHSKWRINLLEHNYFACHLGAARTVEPRWRDQLADDLQSPRFTISLSLGIRLRLRRNYLMLAYFITAVWLTKAFIHPHSPGSFGEFYRRFAVGDLFPCWFVLVTASVFVVGVTALALITPSEEALDNWSKAEHARLSRPPR